MEQPTSGRSLQIQDLSFYNQPCGFSYHGKLNHNAIDKDDVKITTSEFPVESNYE